MLKMKQHCSTFAFILFLCIQDCSALDLRTYKPEKFYNITSINDPNFAFNVSTKESITISPVGYFTRKKWKVGRVSRKQYEIVNMIWRKTNIFNDEESISTTESLNTEQSDKTNQDIVNHLTTIPQEYSLKADMDVAAITKQPSTMSYIEFYYLDESMDSSTVKPDIISKEHFNTLLKLRDKTPSELSKFKNFFSRTPLFAFHLNVPSYKRPMQTSTQPNSSFDKVKAEKDIEVNVTTTNNFLQSLKMRNMAPLYASPSSFTTETSTTRTETPSDRVKFFELYDRNTFMNVNANTTISYKDNEIGENDRIALEKVDKDTGHGPNKVRHAKKHVKGRDMPNFTQFIKKISTIDNKQVKVNVPSTRYQSKQPSLESSTTTPTWDEFYNYTSSTQMSRIWSKYPFVAVYVYERYQVHCDAATISPYWLVASAACISRHREDPDGDRSAFIAYCGENWWNPERIAYVKYTLVHPRYHPQDITRRHLYNIGAIQVVNSMASSCPGWQPVTIMSHQYVTEHRGTSGSAVGWGLNRYDTSYASRDLPRHLLSVYESFIYSNSCPGNSGYENTKRLSEQAISNVYCLALPAYYSETNDPVHGGLLLVEEKLIALYLQEERRRQGDQSAQYTGVWRLVPWILDVAKDPENLEFSLLR